jgi:hypothetical protein
MIFSLALHQGHTRSSLHQTELAMAGLGCLLVAQTRVPPDVGDWWRAVVQLQHNPAQSGIQEQMPLTQHLNIVAHTSNSYARKACKSSSTAHMHKQSHLAVTPTPHGTDVSEQNHRSDANVCDHRAGFGLNAQPRHMHCASGTLQESLICSTVNGGHPDHELFA